MNVRTLIGHLQEADPDAEVVFNMDGDGRVFKGVGAVSIDFAIDNGCVSCYEPVGFREYELVEVSGRIGSAARQAERVFVLWP